MDVQTEKKDRPERRTRPLTPEERIRRRRRRRKVKVIRMVIVVITMLFTLALIFGIVKLTGIVYDRVVQTESVQSVGSERVNNKEQGKWQEFYDAELVRPELSVDLLPVNDYSRPGIELPEVKNIFIHYTANAGTTAQQNRSYFESLGETKERSASAHFVIGYDGVIVQCIPTKEIAYAVMKRNYDSVSIECCYLDENGKFTEATYESLLHLSAWLLHKYKLSPEDVLRHYDEGGKNCPKYYVENEDAWERFIRDLSEYMKSVI